MSSAGIVVVGASLAGLRAVETLRTAGYDGRITLIGDEPHLPYDRPPLSKGVLAGTHSPESTRLRPESFYTDNAVELILGRRAVAVRLGEGSVELAGGVSVDATQVLLATGARARRLSIPGADLPGTHVVRTLDDAVVLAGELSAGAEVVVVGAGFVGAEVAASARGLGCVVTMLEAAPHPLGRVLGPPIAARYAAEHRAQGVDLRLNVNVVAIEGRDRVSAVLTDDGTRHRADVVVAGIGALPNTELAVAAGLTVSDGIVVDELCRTSNPNVFAAGDVANFPSAVTGRRVRRESWQNAADQGVAAALSMLGQGLPYVESPWFWSDQYDLRLHLAGTADAGDEVVWRGDVSSTDFCAFYLRDGVLTAAVGVNRPKDVRAALALVRARRTVPTHLLADPSIDLRKATRSAPAA